MPSARGENATVRPEILAPVGNWEMAQAAVHNGADAIYLGFPGFNARGRAQDLDARAFAGILNLCHLHGVKVYAALNVLVFENELPSLLESARELMAMGLDAFIVQDLGVARLLRQLNPEVRLHASTQMTVTAPEAILLTGDLGLRRYVLARELSLPEIAAVREGTDKELEVFVHGALCVSYSGQCLTSESFGGRSANRGQCAQSCRLPYELWVDGEKRELGDKSYLVSPQDLCGLDEIEALAGIGVDSLKIEGRLKTPAYVAATAKAYRAAAGGKPPSPSVKEDLAITYSRGFFPGWLHGVDHQALVPAAYSHHRGLPLGQVVGCDGERVYLEGSRRPRPGDGLLFLPSPGAAPEQGLGGRVYSLEDAQEGYALTFDHALPLGRVQAGWAAYWNDSPALEKALTAALHDRNHAALVPVAARVSGAPGSPLAISLNQGNVEITVTSEAHLPAADNSPLTETAIREELGRMRGEGFELAELHIEIAAPVFVHGKALRQMRQRAVASLKEKLLRGPEIHVGSDGEILAWMAERAEDARRKDRKPDQARLHVLLRDIAQVEALTAGGGGIPDETKAVIQRVYLDFEYGRDYRRGLEKLREAGYQAALSTTRIMKPLEKHHLTVIEKLRPDAVLVRNLAALQALRATGLPLIGDFSLNVANSLSAEYLLGKGLDRLTPSYDLNQYQLLDLVTAAGGGHFEVTLHQFLPAFHMEHCVFAAFLSEGHSHRDCGKPCEKHRIALKDPTGAEHPVKADQECRNTMFHGKPQSSARLFPSLLAAGVRDFRVEFLWENGSSLRDVLGLYADLLSGAREPQAVFSRLGAQEKYGVSEGQLRQTATWKDRKKS